MSIGSIVHSVIFYLFAMLLVASSVLMVSSKNAVHSALFLVFAFFCSSILWMLLQAEFLSLVLIFVYVGAVMTLFLFVIMMIDTDKAATKRSFVKYLPYAALIVAAFAAIIFLILYNSSFFHGGAAMQQQPADYSNAQAMGVALFTDYLYPFEVAGALLLVGIISAIGLAFYGRKKGTKAQKISEQIAANKESRLRIVDLKSEGKSS